MTQTQLNWAYIAGAFDGDGSYSLIKRKYRTPSLGYSPFIQFANASRPLVEWIQKSANGSIFHRKPYFKDGVSRMSSYHLKISGIENCKRFLRMVKSFAVIKKDRIEFLLSYIDENPFIRGSVPLSNEIRAARERAYIKMKKLNNEYSHNQPIASARKKKNNKDPLFWAYIAGLMDTDGSFTVKKEIRADRKNPTFTAQILLTMNDSRGVYFLHNNFIGGSVCIVKAKTSNQGFCFRFSISSRMAAQKFLEYIIPYLILKKDAAQNVLEFCKNMILSNGPRGISAEQLCLREKFYCKSLEYNGVSKFSLMDLKLPPDNAEDNKAQAAKACSVNAVSGKTSKDDAVL